MTYREGIHSVTAACDKHRRNDHIRSEGEEHKSQVRGYPPPNFNHLQECRSLRSMHLQFCRILSKK